ncbi:MAG: DUF3093 domain-containing protein [Nocardiopsaceae bacterium]|jgi:hypothetical protein|nr:DUF3093 domain-containing protein [Nocardiopsaceae bacterium]
MRVYRERLSVPVSWWLVVTGCVILLGTTLWAGLSIAWAVLIYAVLESAAALLLFRWGAASIEVSGSDLRAGTERLPLTNIADVAALDRPQTTALRGPRADPAAYLLVRPYLHRAVYVAIEGRPAERPYWLIGTRRPAELAAAIDRARNGHAGEDGAGHAARDAMG